MAIFLTSDLHFNHDREFVWKVRGFTSVQEMNETIVKNWNSVVNPDDDVYVLGCVGPCLTKGKIITEENKDKLINSYNTQTQALNDANAAKSSLLSSAAFTASMTGIMPMPGTCSAKRRAAPPMMCCSASLASSTFRRSTDANNKKAGT